MLLTKIDLPMIFILQERPQSIEGIHIRKKIIHCVFELSNTKVYHSNVVINASQWLFDSHSVTGKHNRDFHWLFLLPPDPRFLLQLSQGFHDTH